MNWHYVEQGQQLGPVSDHQIMELDRAGKINSDTLVWHDGMSDWKPLREVRSDLKIPSSAPEAAVPTVNETASQAAIEPGRPEAVCGECGKMFPIDEMIRYGNTRISAPCKPIFMQKLSEGAGTSTSGLRYAGFWIRVGAKILDGLILGVPMMIVFMALIVP